jgi:outer membrane protein assembly factor BamA
MGPRLQWFVNENHNLYFTAEWNPYATGERDKSGTSKDITGSSIGFGFGYRFKINRVLGLGASLNYHSLSITDEKIGTTEDTVSDTVTNMMPMLEFTILTR